MNRRELLTGLMATVTGGGLVANADAAPVATVAVKEIDIAAIEMVINEWTRRSKVAAEIGDIETDERGRASFYARSVSYFNCVRELRLAMGVKTLDGGNEE